MPHAPRPPDPARLAARPLAGRRMAVTRAREQAGDLTRELEALGAEVVAAPTIRIVPLADLAALRAALTRVPPYDWIVFTSQNTVQVMCDRLPEWELAPRDVTRAAVAAIGPATAEILAGTIDVVTFTSSSTVRGFAELVGGPVAVSGRFAAAVIGPVTAETARELGITVAIEAQDYTVPGLVDAIVRHFTEHG